MGECPTNLTSVVTDFLDTCLVAPLYYRGALAAILVYDITNEDSFNDIKIWLEGEGARVRECVNHSVKADVFPRARLQNSVATCLPISSYTSWDRKATWPLLIGKST